MLKVGITGGIGSGKSKVARVFSLFDIPIFNADDAAKYLMNHDSDLKSKLLRSFGKETYKNDRIDRSFLSLLVFQNPEKLKLLNSIVHPATIAFAKEWIAQQNAAYIIKEAALFFESGTAHEMDKIIGVYAPKEMRIRRAVARDAATRKHIQDRMDQQMDEEEKMRKCDYIIFNDESQSIIKQVVTLHKTLIQINNPNK